MMALGRGNRERCTRTADVAQLTANRTSIEPVREPPDSGLTFS
jgi:hypothetical protein